MEQVNNAVQLKQTLRTRIRATGLDFAVGGDGNYNAEIAIVGEAPNEYEVKLFTPFVGNAGKLLWEVLAKHDIKRTMCWTTNVIKKQVSLSTNTAKREPIHRNELAHWEAIIRWELSQLPNLKYVLVLGEYALRALLHEYSITNWRGSVIERDGITYVVANNPAYVMRESVLRVVLMLDIEKLHRVRCGDYTPYNIQARHSLSYNEAVDYIDSLQDEVTKPISLDIETIAGETACIGLSNNEEHGVCINLRTKAGNLFSVDEETKLRLRMQKLFADPNTRFIMQNASFDMSWLWYKDRLRIHACYFDTLLGHHTLYPTMPHNLGFLTAQYTNHSYYKDEKNVWKEGGDIASFWEYNVKDVCVTLRIARCIEKELRQQKLDSFFFSHVMRLQRHLIDMTILGVPIDISLKDTVAAQLRVDVETRLAVFHAAVTEATEDTTYKPNPLSVNQLTDLLFNKLRLVGRGVSTNKTNRDKMLAHPKTSPAARKVLLALDAYKKDQKFLSTYADMVIDPDGYARCEYKQYGTQTAPGRLSSASTGWGSGMNLQNQPERAKPMFVAPPGYRFVYFDLAQAEARCVGWMANIDAWQEQFEKARVDGEYDCHRALASEMFKVPYNDVPKEDRTPDGEPTIRYIAKRCRHGLNYRMGASRLADVTGLSPAAALLAYTTYHRITPQLMHWWDDTINIVYRERKLFTPLGRRFIILGQLPARNAGEATEDARVLDSIIAFQPQSTIGDKVSSVIYQCHDDADWPNNARICLNIHDALIAMCPDNDDVAYKVAQIMRKYAEAPIMINGKPLIIPADFAMSVADEHGMHRWSTLKKLKGDALKRVHT